MDEPEEVKVPADREYCPICDEVMEIGQDITTLSFYFYCERCKYE